MKRHFLILLLTLSVFSYGSQILFLQSGHALERGAGIPEEALPDKLKEVEIKKSFIGSKAREVGSIQTLTGSTIVAHGDLAEAYFALPGDKIYEKDRIFTLGDTRCRLKFIDENVITMGANAEIGVEEIVADLGLGEKKSIFSMTKGKAMFYALKMFRYKKTTLGVQTATAVVGVRGTKFGIEVRKEKEGNFASRPIYLADASDKGWIRLVQNTNNDTVTTVFGFDGQISVTSTADGRAQTVSPGQMLSTTKRGSGLIKTTPPRVARQFESDTEAPPPPKEETTKESDTEKGESPEGTEEEKQDDQEETKTDDSPAATDETTSEETTTTVNTSDLTQQQTSLTVETKEDPIKDPGTNASGNNVGYLSAMLTNSSAGTLEEIFVSTTRQNFDSDSSVWARGSKNPDTDYIRGGDAAGDMGDPYAKWAVFASGTKNTGSLDDNYPITHNELGSYTDSNGNDYLEWGDWKLEKAFTVDGSEYTINNKGHYIIGANTPSSELANLTGAASYSGDAHGTYWTSGGGVDMTGHFTCEVDFGTDEISAVQMDVSGGVYSAMISSGSGAIQSDGTFSITGGTWELNGSTPDHKMAHGSFYGGSNVGTAAAKAIGGAWGMYKTSGEGATGIFHGER